MDDTEKAAKKQRQHEAWLRWYKGPKGEAYRQKMRKRKPKEPVAEVI